MSDNKNCLHKNKLEEFKAWLDKNKIQHRPGKGAYQVLQVLTPKYGWQVVFDKDSESSVHYTVNSMLMSVVRQFVRDTKREGAVLVWSSDNEHPEHTLDDWKAEVAAGNTESGYDDWVKHNVYMGEEV